MAKKMLTDAEAEKLLDGKPKAKGKKRRTEIEADTELEGRMTDAQAKKSRGRSEMEHDPKAVKGGALRGVMQETMARVYEEMFPTMTTRDHRGDVDVEIKEEAYILGIVMMVGHNDEQPRRGLKMREVESLGDSAPYCLEHS